METITRYFAHVRSKLSEVLAHELPNIEKAAEMVAESCKNGGRFYVFGSGHSYLVAEELYLHSGALALVCRVVDLLVRQGIAPPIFNSSNGDGGNAHNNTLFAKYYGYWK